MSSDRWASDGTEVLHLSLVRSKEAAAESFEPEFVYPQFGTEQVIYGYEDLDIQLAFASGSLAPYLNVSYGRKMPTTSTVKPDDIEGLLYKWLPSDYLKDEATFKARVERDAKEFKPLGTRIASYARRPIAEEPETGKGKGKAVIQDESDDEEDDEPKQRWEDCAPEDDGALVFEAWHATMTTPGFRDYLRRFQIFVPFYIEGGEYIDEEDDRWEFVVLYERETKANGSHVYHFAGFTDLYPYLYWPHSTRMRLAQFIILPPYQGAGHGSRLYSLVYLWLIARDEVAELTIEDPSENFQDLRDKADLNAFLHKDAMKGIKAPVDKLWQTRIQREMKLADRQFARIVEMALFLKLDSENEVEAKPFRLMVKERLYRFNYDVLVSMEKKERRDLLKTTYDGLVEDYARLTAPFRHTNGVANGKA